VGTPLHLNCTSSGKVLLSALSEQEFESFLKRTKLVKKTDKSIVEPRILREEIKRVQKQGYAVDDEETEIGGRCAGAPIYNKEGKIVASISVVGPSTRIRQSDLTSLAGLVGRAAGRASVALGYRKNSAPV
jgi:DNA-binding IclR family transcriptional regulator